MKKCKYCGREISNSFEFCCNKCENNYTKNIEKAEDKIKYFIIGIIIGFLVMIYGVLSNSDFIIGGGIIVMGIVAAVLPFVTPETGALLGYQKSRIAGRILGILLIVVGIWVGFV